MCFGTIWRKGFRKPNIWGSRAIRYILTYNLATRECPQVGLSELAPYHLLRRRSPHPPRLSPPITHPRAAAYMANHEQDHLPEIEALCRQVS
jgi:hypothetical protein